MTGWALDAVAIEDSCTDISPANVEGCQKDRFHEIEMNKGSESHDEKAPRYLRRASARRELGLISAKRLPDKG